MAADFGRSISPAGPASLPALPWRYSRNGAWFVIQYDLAADGKRFIVLEKATGEPPLAIHVVHNWFEEFRGQHR